MPESPEVQALVEQLAEHSVGCTITGVDVLEFRAVKTRARQPSGLIGARISGVSRHGKHVDMGFEDGRHLVISLGRHGWVRRAAAGDPADDSAADASPADRPPALIALELDDGSLLELTDAGSWVSLGAYVVDDPLDVPAVAKLGPDPADPAFTRAQFDAPIAGRRKQLKAILQEQESLAGIGNAYSDEILHRARLSPVVHAASLEGDELDRLFDATVAEISEAIAARRDIPIDRLKAAKVAAMRVHGRAGEACPRCGDTVRDFAFASTTAEYCPHCQTGGELLLPPRGWDAGSVEGRPAGALDQ
ncbi:DNA-formamidopyrimidine glycosylase family protein [Agromyces soli]